MNKPIRTVSIFCLLLFLALMVNATYLQYWQAGGAQRRPAQPPGASMAAFSRERGAILVGRNPVARERASPTTSTSSSAPTRSRCKYAPITGYFSYYGQTGIERSQNAVLSGDDSRLFVNRFVDLLSNDPPRAATSQLTINPEAQEAAYDGLDGARRRTSQGSVVALEPATGKILAMVSLPTFDPNELASHDLGAVDRSSKRARRGPGEAAAQPRHPDPAAPGLDVQARHRGGRDRDGRLRRRLAGAGRRDLPAAADQRRDRRDRQRGPQLRRQRRQDPVQPGDGAVLQHHVRPDRRRGRRRGDGQDRPRSSASTSTLRSRTSRRQADSVFPEDIDEPQTGQTGIGQFEVRGDPAADGDGRRRHRQRRRR